MIRRNRANSSSLFLLELILAILFFSIASAVCVQFFVKSHLLSQDAWKLNISVNEVSSATELIQVSPDARSAIDLIHTEYPDSEISDVSKISVYYDRDFLSCAKAQAVYCLEISFIQKGSMLDAALNMKEQKDEKIIYSLTISHHLQRRPGNGQ
ncbi:MAG: hypothetical protein H2212_15590 [Ruminococcus sp.]|jgi:hypothetical protein|nr:hypothetical protein [Ruminococcus sp.]